MECEIVVTRHGSKYPKLNGVEPDCPECSARDSVLFLGTWEETKETPMSVLKLALFGVEPKKTGRTGMEFECKACGCRFDVYVKGRMELVK